MLGWSMEILAVAACGEKRRQEASGEGLSVVSETDQPDPWALAVLKSPALRTKPRWE